MLPGNSGGSGTQTLASNATESQALAYLSAYWGSAKYTNSQSTPYNDKDAEQIYAYIKSQHPTGYTPYQYAQAAQDVMLSSAVAKGISTGTSEGLTAIGDSAVAAGNSANYPSLPSWLSGLDSFAHFLNALGSANLWIRVAKVAVGGTLILIATAKITGAGSVISKLPVPIPV